MGGLLLDLERSTRKKTKGPNLEVLHLLQCKACPLNKAKVCNPKMPSRGDKEPVVYMLGPNLSGLDDKEGEHFAGEQGDIIRSRIPREYRGTLRWNNVVRTATPNGRPPDLVEMECCRPSVVEDIERTKPVAIFGFGNVPLVWSIGMGGRMDLWRGRRIPVKVGNHTCWYFPMLHPSWIIGRRRFTPRGSGFGCEDERMFAFDIQRAFDWLINRYEEPMVHTAEVAEAGIAILVGRSGAGADAELAAFEAHLKNVMRLPEIGFDYETNMLRPYNHDARILSFAIGEPDGGMAVAFDHPTAGWDKRGRRRLEEMFKDFFLSYKGDIVVHSSAFEIEWTVVKFGREFARKVRWKDTKSQAFVLDERNSKQNPSPLSLGFLTQQYFGFNIKQLFDVDRKRMAEMDVYQVLPYNGVDAKYHLLTYKKQKQLIRDQKLSKVFREMNRTVPTVVLTQVKGVPVNQKTVKKYQKIYTRKLSRIEDKIFADPDVRRYEKKYGDFNPSSNDDLKRFFVRFLKFNLISEKTGKVTTDEKMLKTIDHPLAKLIPRYRNVLKMKSTYIDPLRKGSPILYDDGLLHPILNTTDTDTNRLSSEDPNEQNYPKRKDKEIRQQIAVSKGGYIAAIDYGQIEARGIAMESRDKWLVRSMWENHDIHTDWSEWLAKRYPTWIGGRKNLSNKEVMKKHRDLAKNKIVFPAFFGSQPKSIAANLGVPLPIVEEMFEEFWDKFPGVREWQVGLDEFYKEYGYVQTLNGFRRRGPLSWNQIINTPIQGVAAEIVKDAMNRLSETEVWEYQANMNIHDDLTFMFDTMRDMDRHLEFIIDKMLAVPFEFVNVPILVELSVGENWCDLEEVEKFSSDKWHR